MTSFRMSSSGIGGLGSLNESLYENRSLYSAKSVQKISEYRQKLVSTEEQIGIHPKMSPIHPSNESISSNISDPDFERIASMIPTDEDSSLTPAEISLMQKVLRSHLLDTGTEVEIIRRDVRSPLYSAKTFEQLQLPPNLLKGVYGMGYNAPSKIQETTLPTLMADPPVNMIAQSQSGTGKTAAFVLASLFRVRPELQYPQVLILAPTYELAIQIGEVAKQMARFCEGVEFRFAVKEQKLPRGHKLQEHIVIGTPGKVFDWAVRHQYFSLKMLSLFVLDEADIMISIQGHQDQCIRIHKQMLPECQMLLFSATYTAEVMDFAEMIIKEPIIIRLKREDETLDNVEQYYIECESNMRKYISLSNVYGVVSIGQTIVFCKTKMTAAWLGAKLTEDGHDVGYLSSELNMDQRVAVLTRFRKGFDKVLITTNVLARGIDIEQVTMVINFDLPVTVSGKADCETYLHRIGRSGRFGKSGIAINMVVSQSDMEILRSIEEHFGKKILKLDAEDVDALEKLDS